MKSLRKLFLASLMLFVALFAVIASTFAWFTIQQNPQIDEFNVDITSGEGLSISLNNGADYKLIWSNNEFLATLPSGGNFLNYFELDTVTPRFDRVTEGETTTFTFANEFQKLTYNNPPFPWETNFNSTNLGHYTLTIAEPNIRLESPTWISGKYISFDVFFKAETDLNVYVQAAEVNSDNANAENSARFGFLPHTNNEGVHTPDLANFKIFDPAAIKGDTQVFGEGDFFSRNRLYENFRALMTPTPTETSTDVIRVVPSLSDPQIYQIAFEDPENPGMFIFDEDYVEFVKSITFDYTNPEPLIVVPAGDDAASVRKLTVFIWLEGWDGQATDEAKGAILDVFLRFTGYQDIGDVVTP